MSDLIHLIYASRAKFAAGRAYNGIEPNVARILAQSRKNNPKREIGGVLYYGDGNFFQCLEGERAEVESVFEKIQADPRHGHVRVLAEYPVKQRVFLDWSMKYVPVEREVGELLRAAGLDRFDPFQFDGRMVSRMLALLQGAIDPTDRAGLDVHPPAVPPTSRPLVWAPIALGAMALLIATAALMVALGVVG